MMNNRNFLYNIDQLQQLFKNNISVVFDSNYYKKNINKKLLDLR